MSAGLNEIPIEFIPGLWVSQEEGIRGRGSGFLLAENIKSVVAVDTKVPNSKDATRNWNILNVTQKELTRESYLGALIRIITESWLETNSVMILGSPWSIQRILVRFLQKTGGMAEEVAAHVVSTKIGG